MKNIDKQIIMSYTSFKEKIINNLASYNYWGDGTFKGKSYKHIANITGRGKKDVILEIIKRDGVEIDKFRKPHPNAHHLNSSQIVCYEFFRPLINNKDNMVKALEIMEIPSCTFITDNAEFEKEFVDGEGTNFDFCLPLGPQENLYVEVKYTEQGFGLCKDDENHKQKFEKFYKDRINNSFCIKDDLKGKIDFEQMRKHYQLFRNTLQIQSPSDYVVFLFPEENSIAKKQFNDFKEQYLSSSGCQNVKGVYWESLIPLMSNLFKDKFFFYV